MASLSMTFKLLGKDVSASKAFKGVGKAADGVGKRVQGMGLMAGASALAIGAAALKMGADSVAAFTESEASQTKLQDAYARFPALASGNIEAIRALGAERAKVTRFDDDATAAAAAQLAQFGLNQGQLEDMIPLVQDYAAKTGQDLPSASAKVGKALLGNTKALKELGISYKPTGDKAKDYANIQALLNKQVGGFAEKEGKTAAGQAAILGNQFGEVQETVGAALLPILMTLADFAITTLIPAVQSLAKFVSDNIVVIGILAGAVGAYMAITKVAAIAQGIYSAVMAAGTVASGGATAATWSLNAALLANPIGLVVIALVALVGGLILAYNKSETFRNIVQGAWTGIKAAAEAVVGWFQNTAWPMLKKVIDFIIGYYKMLWTAFKLVAGWIGEKVGVLVGVFTAMADTIYGAFKTVFNGIASLWNNTVGRLSFGVPDWVPGIGGKGFDVPDIPMLANGGIVTKPTLALIGEAGPEAVIPLGRGGMTGGVVLNFYGPVAGPGAGRWLMDEIAKAQGSGRVRKTG